MAIEDIANALNQAADDYNQTQQQFAEAHQAHATAEETLSRGVKVGNESLRGAVAMRDSLTELTSRFNHTSACVDQSLGFVMLASDTVEAGAGGVAAARASTDAIAANVLQVTEQTFNGKIEEGRGWSRMLASDTAEHAEAEPGLKNAIEVALQRDQAAQERHTTIANLIGQLATEIEGYIGDIRTGVEEAIQTHAIAKQQMIRDQALGDDAKKTAKILRAGAKAI